MTIPGFTALASLDPSRGSYAAAMAPTAIGGRVYLQGCDFWKRIGCGIWPELVCWPALASAAWDNRAAFIDCVDKLSGGGCVDCVLDGIDPRNRGLAQN